MQFKDLKTKSETELQGLLAEERTRLHLLRMRKVVNQVKDVREFREIRQRIARVLTQLTSLRSQH